MATDPPRLDGALHAVVLTGGNWLSCLRCEVRRSTDVGLTWTVYASESPACSVRIDPTAPQVIFDMAVQTDPLRRRYHSPSKYACNRAALLDTARLPARRKFSAWARTIPKRTDLSGAPPVAILWVGNSFFYYNNSLHNKVLGLVRATDPRSNARATSITISGSGIDWHDEGGHMAPLTRPELINPVIRQFLDSGAP